MKRNKGYYWVKREDVWQIAYYDGYVCWKLVGVNYDFTDFSFQEINECEVKNI